jgi:3-dehydroquinate synthase
VYFTHNIFDTDNPLFEETVDRLHENRTHRIMVYVDSGVADTHPDLDKNIKEYFHARPGTLELVGTPVVVQGGEIIKSEWDTVRDLLWTFGNQHMCRQSYVTVIGGGSVLDMVGFAASLVHRGLRLIRIPTTVLAQNDAGVGVKNGMNEHGMKNFMGTFAPPFAVINDFNFLKTLTQEHWTGGIAEAFKVAIIKDKDFFGFLCGNALKLKERDQESMEYLVRKCAVIHLEHIRTNGDPFEFGTARPLDFGHWAAHKLESMSEYSIGHGQAVSIGIALDSFYAMRKGLINESDFQDITLGLAESGLPIWHELLERSAPEGLEILDGLNQFREHLGGTLTVTLPDSMGQKCEVHQMNYDLIEEGVAELRTRNQELIKQHENR